MNNLKKFLSSALIIVYFFVAPVFAMAQGNLNTVDDSKNTTGSASEYAKIKNPIGVDTVNGLVKTILEGIIKIGIPIVAIAIIYSGFLFVTAQGKPDKLKTAKDAFMYTLIGAAVLLGAWALAQLISDTVLAL